MTVTAKRKEQMNLYAKEYRQNNKEKRTEQQRRYKQANKEQLAEYDKQYELKNKAHKAEYRRQYRQTHKHPLTDAEKAYQRAYYHANKERLLKQREKYREKHGAKWRQHEKLHRRKRLYGLTHDEFLSLLTQQNYQCAICHTLLTEQTAKTDHCHKTGLIRGILCHGCNVSLGHFRDDISVLENAIAYLKRGINQL